MSQSTRPFDDIRELIKKIPKSDENASSCVNEKIKTFLNEGQSLGRLEDLAIWLAAWQRKESPEVLRPAVTLFASSYGVSDAQLQDQQIKNTQRRVADLAEGKTAISQLCKAHDLTLKVYELALELPSGNIAIEDAFSEKDCAATIAFGLEAIAGGVDLLCIGDVGDGHRVSSAAIFTALYGGKAKDWLPLVEGSSAEDSAMEVKIIDKALSRAIGHNGDGLEILRRLGGREIAAICGAILAARMEGVPVIIDGYVALSSLAILHALDESLVDHCVLAHSGNNQSYQNIAHKLSLRPLLDLDIQNGQGCGAVFAALMIKTATNMYFQD